MTLFESQSYKEAIRFALNQKKAVRKSFTFEKMAAFCRVQKTYLSKVLNKSGNLNLDQLYLACEYLQLSPIELRFVENLYHENTSTIQKRAEKYKNALTQIRNEALQTENSIQVHHVPEQIFDVSQERYYLDPYYQLIHMFLTIKKFSQDPKEICQILGIAEEKLGVYLENLMKWGFIKSQSSGFIVVKESIHLTKTSPLTGVHRNLTRSLSKAKMNQLDESDFYAFSVSFSCDGDTKDKIQKKFLQFLKESQALVAKSKSEEVFQMNFDLLKWG